MVDLNYPDTKRQKICLGLDRVRDCLGFLGNPQKNFKSILIAGTNGKGSVTYYLSQLTSNFTTLKTARYISPHLVLWSERFRINEKNVDDVLLEHISKKTLDKIKTFENKFDTTLTEFEIYTIIAFCLFAEQKVNIAFLEVGMGGRLDATNVVDSEDILCSVITNVSYDHMDYLGNTIEQIAFEKAGIVKENNFIVTGAEDVALGVISNQTKKIKAELVAVDTKDCEFYMDKNIKVALSAWKQILDNLNEVKDGNYEQFLRLLQFPGRFHFFEKERILLDGAHNPHAAIELRKLIEDKFSNKKVIYIVGMLDKDYESFIKNLIPKNSYVVCTKPDSRRTTSKELLLQSVLSNASSGDIAIDLAASIKLAKTKEHDIIVITGSLYLVGEAMKLLKYPPIN